MSLSYAVASKDTGVLSAQFSTTTLCHGRSQRRVGYPARNDPVNWKNRRGSRPLKAAPSEANSLINCINACDSERLHYIDEGFSHPLHHDSIVKPPAGLLDSSPPARSCQHNPNLTPVAQRLSGTCLML